MTRADVGASDVTGSARATLDAWRECGADRLNPIRFHFIEALERRAAAHCGEARRLLDQRLSGLIAAYAGDLERAASNAAETAVDPGSAASSAEPALDTLAGLVGYVSNPAPADGTGHGPARANAVPRRSAYPELEVLDYFRQTWSKLRSEKQLRQSLRKAPDNAGPLNSSSLVHRSLSLMRELSPGYLQQFLSYVDALSWMEQMNGGSALPVKDAPRATTAKKSARSKSR